MDGDQLIVEAGRFLRSHLNEYLDSDEASQLDSELAQALNSDRAAWEIARRISSLAGTNKKISGWLDDFVYTRTPLSRALTRQDLGGNPSTIEGHFYRCPENDYIWFERDSGAPLPTCPTHGLKLVPEKRAQR